jgi:hypothetical protein
MSCNNLLHDGSFFFQKSKKFGLVIINVLKEAAQNWYMT